MANLNADDGTHRPIQLRFQTYRSGVPMYFASLKVVAQSVAITVENVLLIGGAAFLLPLGLCLLDIPGWRAYRKRQVFAASAFLLKVPKFWFGSACATALLLMLALVVAIIMLPWRIQRPLLAHEFLGVPVYIAIFVGLLGAAIYLFLVNRRRTPALHYQRWAIEFHRLDSTTTELHISFFSRLLHRRSQPVLANPAMEVLSPKLSASRLAPCVAVALDQTTLASLQQSGVCKLVVWSPLITEAVVAQQLADPFAMDSSCVCASRPRVAKAVA